MSDTDDILIFTRDEDGTRSFMPNILGKHSEYRITLCDHALIASMDQDFATISVPWYVAVCFTLFSLTVGIIACLPYLTYEGFLSDTAWDFFCVGRACTYGVVFFVAWLDATLSFYKFFYQKTYGGIITCSLLKSIRWVFGICFALLYAFLYSLKWYHLDGVYIKYAAVISFFISWAIVFFKVIDKQLSSSISVSGSVSSSLSSRRRRVLLYSIKTTEQLCYSSEVYSTNLYNQLMSNPSFAILFTRMANAVFYQQDREEILTLYDEKAFDRWSETRSSIMNLVLGISLIATTLSMLEDYGNAIHVSFGLKPEPYLWLATVFCSVLACLYITATYSIHHKNAQLSRYLGIGRVEWKQWLYSLVYRLPILFMGGLIASIRMNSSYSMYGKIAGAFQMPYSIGLTLIWCGIIIVFLVDFGACVKILSYAIKRLVCLICVGISHPSMATRHLHRCCVIRYHTKRLKWLVRNCHEDVLKELTQAVLR